MPAPHNGTMGSTQSSVHIKLDENMGILANTVGDDMGFMENPMAAETESWRKGAGNPQPRDATISSRSRYASPSRDAPDNDAGNRCSRQTQIVCVQVRTRPIRDGLDAVLRGLPTVYFQRLKYEMNLAVLIARSTELGATRDYQVRRSSGKLVVSKQGSTQ